MDNDQPSFNTANVVKGLIYRFKIAASVYHVCIRLKYTLLRVPLENVWCNVRETLNGLSKNANTMIKVDDTVRAIIIERWGTLHGKRVMGTVPSLVLKVPQIVSQPVLYLHVSR